MAKKYPSKAKAKKMLRHGKVRGKKLTRKQVGMLSMLAAGKFPQEAK